MIAQKDEANAHPISYSFALVVFVSSGCIGYPVVTFPFNHAASQGCTVSSLPANPCLFILSGLEDER